MTTTPKTIAKICELLNASWSFIRFKHAATGVYDKRKGYSFVSNHTNLEILEVQPVNYSNGDKWLISGNAITSTVAYAKNIADLYRKLPTLIPKTESNTFIPQNEQSIMKTFKKSHIPETIEYNGNTYVLNVKLSHDFENNVQFVKKDCIKLICENKRLRGKTDLHGQLYKPTIWIFSVKK